MSKKNGREAKAKRRAARAAHVDRAVGTLPAPDFFIPGTTSVARVLRHGCETCQADTEYVEGTFAECGGCNDPSRALAQVLAERGTGERVTAHYLRRCANGHEDLYHSTSGVLYGRPPLPGDAFEYKHEDLGKLTR